MNKARLLLRYIAPYKWSAIKNILFNLLNAIFALISYTLVIPILKIKDLRSLMAFTVRFIVSRSSKIKNTLRIRLLL